MIEDYNNEDNIQKFLKKHADYLDEYDYLETNPKKFSCVIEFSEFIENILNHDYDNYHNNFKDLRQEHGEKVKQYVLQNEMKCWFNDHNEFDMGTLYDHEININILSRDWYCFLMFNDDTDNGGSMVFWLININPTCVLFEYVIECPTTLEISPTLYHFSQMDKEMDRIKILNTYP